MDHSYHPSASTHTKPRGDNISCSTTTCFSTPTASPQKSLKTSHTPHTSSKAVVPQQASTRKKLLPARVHFNLHMSIHQDRYLASTSPSTSMTESGLWTLPGFDDDDDDSSKTSHLHHAPPPQRPRTPQSATSPTRHRHGTCFERESWALICGRYSDDEQAASDESGESVDEEFDVVLLSRE
ncbi:hypothetical protein EKO04_003205 [Ascochyta lentis]|uniref:Uncharacterized protein n=1 Tax=Ascochyta lentis TaxID=205686 RepID=A0A8H7MKX7_9PLEO|nr:hypothetical protein EKO04_003205 [Ascochyta lentis]